MHVRRNRETRRQGGKELLARFLVSWSPSLLIFVCALGLRLLVWRWHAQYPLGGDEQEYFGQALTLLRTRRYVELQLMRPPLYTGFLAACIYLFDSLVQRLRLIQAIISALTVVPVYLLTRRLFGARTIALLAALLAALNYTLAANATELLTETLFVFGLTLVLWLLLATDQGHQAWPARRPAMLAGFTLGALILLRSVALPLLPLGTLWLLARGDARAKQAIATPDARLSPASLRWWRASTAFALAAALVIVPWTARNYAVYGTLILVDTTGAENLWLDNNPAASTPADPLGREAAKRALYAFGDDRGERQRIATRRGSAAIMGDPAWFAQKAWGQAQEFFALQYVDDMRERRAIWVPPLEVWLRLLLGDGTWLVLLLGSAGGLWLVRQPTAGDRPPAVGAAITPSANPASAELSGQQTPALSSFILHPSSFIPQAVSLIPPPATFADPRWLFVPWLLYTLFTAMLFHVELRYRLPLYPVLLPYAAWAIAHCRLQIADWKRLQNTISKLRFKILGLILTLLILITLTLLHKPYLGEGWMLANKHAALWRAERALARGDAAAAAVPAEIALGRDPESALARVGLARSALAQRNQAGALAQLDAAIGALKAQPYAHLLRGAILREQGDAAGAAAEFAYEPSSQQDLQNWSWTTFAPFATIPPTLDVGRTDLGFVQGFWLPENGARWSRAEAQVQLAAPQSPELRLDLQLSAARPAGAPAPEVTISIGGQQLARLAPGNDRHEYHVAIPAALVPADRRLIVTIRSTTFRPRDYDRASPDDRELGVLVRRIAIVAP